MSSTERAPEPTMEEILASIRRIITDDETGQAKAQKAEPQAQQGEDAEGEADNQIIDDIARVLSGGGVPAAEEEEEEEILDLTAELGGLELVEEEGAETEEAQPEAAARSEPAPVFMGGEAAPPAPSAQDMAPPHAEQPAPLDPPQPQAAPPAPEPAPEPQSASQEAASALERAIAALRAGQVPTSSTPQAEPFQFHAAPLPEPTPEPEPVPMATPMEAPEPEAETHPEYEPQFGAAAEPEPEADFEAQPESAPALDHAAEPEQEAELVLTEVEVDVVSEVAGETSEPERAPFWPGETETPEPEAAYETGPVFESEPEPEPFAAQVNGGGHHQGESKTLEDSVKDMLRPMLRQWLDENMPRMIRDELDPEAVRRHQD